MEAVASSCTLPKHEPPTQNTHLHVWDEDWSLLLVRERAFPATDQLGTDVAHPPFRPLCARQLNEAAGCAVQKCQRPFQTHPA